MSVGKIAAAAAHASLGIIFDRSHKQEGVYLEPRSQMFPTDFTEVYKYWFTLTKEEAEWKDGIFTKICLKAKNAEEIELLVNLASQVGILTKKIYDAGKTEVDPGSLTAAAIGPFDPEKSLSKQTLGKLKSLPLLS